MLRESIAWPMLRQLQSVDAWPTPFCAGPFWIGADKDEEEKADKKKVNGPPQQEGE